MLFATCQACKERKSSGLDPTWSIDPLKMTQNWCIHAFHTFKDRNRDMKCESALKRKTPFTPSTFLSTHLFDEIFTLILTQSPPFHLTLVIRWIRERGYKETPSSQGRFVSDWAIATVEGRFVVGRDEKDLLRFGMDQPDSGSKIG